MEAAEAEARYHDARLRLQQEPIELLNQNPQATVRRCPFCNTPNCTGTSQQELVDNLVRCGVLCDPAAIRAFKALDRACFQSRSPDPFRNPYIDGPLPIGFGVQMSAPHVHAITIELLMPWLSKRGSFLDVGSGSGFMCAAMALSAGPESVVHAREHMPELVEHSRMNIADAGAVSLLESGQLCISACDGLSGEQEEMYDAINCGAASEQVPRSLLSQLKVGGRLVIPLGRTGEPQWLSTVDKLSDGDEQFRVEKKMLVIFVPLTSAKSQLLRPVQLVNPAIYNKT